MVTRIEKITDETLEEAKKILFSGGVVAIPTETVYGLGGNAFDDDAVKHIFEIKGRPNDNPLIAHVHENYNLKKIIDYDPPYAKKLREAFLPGPLTLVYPSKGRVSPFVSCGLDTLAVRVPSHEGAQAFLRAVDIPVVAPSANLSRHVSPTSAEHVFDDFNGKIPLILDGGNCVGGIESTVCDVTGEVPVILRPGLVTREMIASVVGRCEVASAELKEGERAKSPGMLYKHYSPRCKTLLFPFDEADKARAAYFSEKEKGERAAVLCERSVAEKLCAEGIFVLDLGETEREMAARLYGLLREAEGVADVLIAIEPRKQDGVMAGVMNRLKKACSSRDIAH
ncbi:MAG: threonylcarbamoyl-AMP synthase [Clostridia bacterium]|nr:threonylcarbamoyl-AMP synthase [Clostridia bacterium]